jgi:hypothetical protein
MDMAKKRRIVVEALPKKEGLAGLVNEDPLPEKYQGTTWKEWLLKVYARYWYIVLCLFVDAIGLMMIRFDTGSLGLGILFAIVAISFEYLIYRRLWGRRRNSL